VIITPLPLYHIFSLTANCLVFMTLGGENVLIPNPRDIPGFVKQMGKYRFTAITGVNTLFNALVNNARFRKLDFSSLRLTLGGGMAVQQAVAEKWKEITGVPLIEAYGLTETSPAATINPLDLPRTTGRSACRSPPRKSFCATTRATTSRWECPAKSASADRRSWPGTGTVRTRRTRSSTATAGSPPATFGVMDERGYVRIVDRKKDMILVSGFNVYPNEIEAVVAMHPGVLECAAVGVPDRKSGEAVKVFIVRSDAKVTAEDILAHCRKHLNRLQVPRDVEFRTQLPKSNVGKILRRELRDEAKKQAA
jgi:long-chain acyl-CoA synthetase